MLLRGLFLSLPDFGKIYDVEGLKKNNDSWPALLGVIATINILATGAVYVCIWLIKEAE